MKKKLCLMALTLILGVNVNAQQLLSPSYGFSKKKTSYVTLENGVEIKGTVSNIKYKKGLIKQIKIEDGTGTKHKLKPNAVKFMYVYPSGLDQIRKALDVTSNVQKWNNEKLDQDILNQGYVYFETVNVKIKKKTRPMLMQLLNPTFSKKVKIYDDPFAKKTMALGVAGVNIVGGNAKSYYVKLDSDPAAYKLEKKRYKKEFAILWNKCSALTKTTNIDWSDLAKHVIEYTECE